jgi:hypothetical protein
MSDQLIDQYVDRASVAGDTQFLKDQLKEVLTLFDKVNSTKITLGGTYNIKDLTAGSKELKEQMEALFKENQRLKQAFDEVAAKLENLTKKKKDGNDPDKDGTNAAAKAKQKLLFLYTDEAKVQAAAREEIRKRNAELKDQVKAESAVTGSINAAIAANKRLRMERNALDLSTDDGKKRLLELNEQIDKNTQFITENNDKLTQRKINIGNYVGAAKFTTDILAKSLEDLRKEIAATNKAAQATQVSFSVPTGPAAGNVRSPGGAPRAGNPNASREVVDFGNAAKDSAEKLAALNKQEEILSRVVESQAQGFASATAEAKSYEKVLQAMEAAGMANTPVFKALLAETAGIKDGIGDLRSEIKALSSDTRAFDLFASSISFVASAYQTAAGAAVAFGASEEDAQEATKNLVAIENVANGTRGVANELTTRGTAANKVYAFFQAQVAIAMNSTATATARLKAGLLTLGIPALLIGIGLLITNFSKLKDLLSRTSEQQKLLNQINKEAISNYVQEKVAVEALVREAQSETTSKRRKKEIIKELNELSPTYFGNIQKETDLQDKLNLAVEKYVKVLSLKAQAQAATNLLVAKEQKVIERQADLEQQLEEMKTKNFGSEEKRQENIRKFQAYILSGGDKILNYYQKQAEPLRKILATIQAQIDGLGGDVKPIIDFAAIDRKDAAAMLEIYKRRLQAEADYQKELSQVELLGINDRIAARNKAFELEKKIILAQKAFDLGEKELTEKQIANIEDEANKNTLKKAQETFTDLSAIYTNFRTRQREEQEKTLQEGLAMSNEVKGKTPIEELVDREEKAFERRKAYLEENRDILIMWLQKERNDKLLAAKSEEDRQKIEKEFSDKRLQQELDTNALILQAALETAEKKLQILKKSGNENEVAQLQRLIAELKRQLVELKGTKVDINVENATSKLEKLRDGILEVAGKVSDAFSAIGDLMGANIDREKNAIQDQIDAIDKKKEKEIEAVNASVLSEEEKANKVTLINAKAQSDREALERRQRQLDLQRARFDKVKNIMDAIAKGAVAVIDGLLKGGPALAAIYGAIAGVQIAAAIAAPIPRFKHGRTNGPATFGIVGDGGVQEVIYSKNKHKAFLTPAKDTFTYIPEGYGVAPSVEDFHSLMMATARPKPVIQSLPIQNDNSQVIHAMTRGIHGLKTAIVAKQETHFHWDNGELQKSIKKGNNWLHYKQNNT